MKKLFLVVFLATALHASAQDIQSLMPRPKSAFPRQTDFPISTATEIVVPDGASPDVLKTVQYLQILFKKEFGQDLKVVTNFTTSEVGAIFIGESGTLKTLDDQLLNVIPHGETLPDSGGYILDISGINILLTARDGAGIFNGASTLSQLLFKNGNLLKAHGAHIWDFPDYDVRWIFSQHNMRGANAVNNLKALADTMARYKLNGITQTDFKLGILEEQPANYFKNVDTLKQYWDGRNIEIIPGVAGIGWSSSLLWKDPNLAEGIPVTAKFVMESDTGRLIPDSRVAFPNGGFETVDANGQFTGWSFYDGAGLSSFVDKSIFRSGKQSARNTDFKKGNSAGNNRYQRKMSCEPNKYYVLSAWVKTENLDADMVQLLTLGNDNGTTRSLTFTSLEIPATTNGWQKVEVVFNTLNYKEVLLYAGVWGGRSGTIWWDDIAVQEGGLTNILRREGTPVWIKRMNGEIVKEGRDIDSIIDPLLAQNRDSYGPYHKPPTMRRIGSGLLKNGDSITISYFHPFTAVSNNQGNGSVMVCLSEPKTDSLLKDQIERVHDLFKNEKFFLQHDEIRNMNHDSACLERNLSPAELLADNITKCDAMTKSVQPGADNFIWSDMIDSVHNARNNYYLVNGDLTGSWRGIPKNLTVVNWNGGKKQESMDFFSKSGFKQISSPYYDAGNADGIRAWRLAQQNVSGIRGMMYTTWGADYRFLKEFSYYAWSAGPYIIHTPLDSNVFNVSTTVSATIYSDPFDNSDVITSAKIILRYTHGGIEEYILSNTSDNHFSGEIPAQKQPFQYYITAVNSQGLKRETPRYIFETNISNSVEENSFKTFVEITPNPAAESAKLTFDAERGTWNIRLTDALGREVLKQGGESAFKENIELSLDVSQFPAGVYYCEILTGTKRTVIPVIISGK